jgi:dihydrofolate reductase
MGQVILEITMSLDGYVAGPDQSPDAPLGVGGEQLHEWALALASWQDAHGGDRGATGPEDEMHQASIDRTGATIMGRNMFGGGGGEWDFGWQGWWGDEPPFHHPVFVLTHHPREPLTLADTTFTFVTDGIESALAQAREAAGGKDVKVAGGAEAVNEYLAAGLVDELLLHIAPLLLGSGSRLFEGVGPVRLERTDAVESAFGVAHGTYRVVSGNTPN